MKTKLIIIAIIACFCNSCGKEKGEETGAGGGSRNGSCWCTDYVAHEVKIIHYLDAYLWTEATLGTGYSFISIPETGCVIVMGINNNGIGKFGHVGIVKAFSTDVNGNYIITIHGANQLGAKTYECDCDNVSDWNRTISQKDIIDKKVSFYKKTPSDFKCFKS
jgi:surface antigen